MTPKRRFRLPLGTVVGNDGQPLGPYAVTQRDLERGAYFLGDPGSGKTSVMSTILHACIRRGSPAIVFDGAGALYANLQADAASYAVELDTALVEMDEPPAVRVRVRRRKIDRRFTFMFGGHGQPTGASIDLLKPRKLLDRTETVEEVVTASKKALEARFPTDVGDRVQLLENSEQVYALLCVAQLPITRYLSILEEPGAYQDALARAHHGGMLDDPATRAYVEPLLRKLDALLLTRRTYDRQAKQYVERLPFPTKYLEYVGSATRSHAVLRPGGVCSKLFEADSFDPSTVAFGQGVFAYMADINDLTNRAQVSAWLYCFWERLLLHRIPDSPNARYRLFLVRDEVRDFSQAFAPFFAVARNHRVSAWLAHQREAQFAEYGLPPALAETLPGDLRYHVEFRKANPKVADPLAPRFGPYDPMGLVRPFETQTDGTSAQDGDSVADGVNRTYATSTTTNRGVSHAEVLRRALIASAQEPAWQRTDSTVDGTTDSDAHTVSRTVTKSHQRGTSKATVGNLHVVPVAEQVLLRSIQLQTLPEYRAAVTIEDRAFLVDVAPPTPPRYPAAAPRLLASHEARHRKAEAAERERRRLDAPTPTPQPTTHDTPKPYRGTRGGKGKRKDVDLSGLQPPVDSRTPEGEVGG